MAAGPDGNALQQLQTLLEYANLHIFPSGYPSMNAEELLANWFPTYAAGLPQGKNVIGIRRADPRFQTRNFSDRFKIEIAKLDGAGQNPTDRECFVLEVSVTDQSADVVSTSCLSIADL
jgi:hypothetical protein